MTESLGARFRLVQELHEPAPTSALFLTRVLDEGRRELRTERWATAERSLAELGAPLMRSVGDGGETVVLGRDGKISSPRTGLRLLDKTRTLTRRFLFCADFCYGGSFCFAAFLGWIQMKGLRPDRHTGRRIKKRRKELGLSQRDVASTTVSYAYVSRVEAGQRVPSWSALIELAEKLDTTALELGLGRAHDCPVSVR